MQVDSWQTPQCTALASLQAFLGAAWDAKKHCGALAERLGASAQTAWKIGGGTEQMTHWTILFKLPYLRTKIHHPSKVKRRQSSNQCCLTSRNSRARVLFLNTGRAFHIQGSVEPMISVFYTESHVRPSTSTSCRLSQFSTCLKTPQDASLGFDPLL
jgi:hypothetical protein